MKIGFTTKVKFVLALAIATPGIPEYLSGSWNLSLLFSHPVNFLAFLLFNLGLYTSGAILIREFAARFNKGWFSIFLMGCAYGIVEEAIALHTFFQVTGSPVGFLGTYGRFIGVDWVWAFGLAIFHAVFSITLPILLISIAYPDYSNKKILGKSGVAFFMVIYGLMVIVLNFIINHTSARPVPTYPDYLFSTVIALILVVIAYFLPRDFLHFRGKTGNSTLILYFIGLLIYPVYNLFAFIPVNAAIVTRISPILDILIHLILFCLMGAGIIYLMPSKDNKIQKFALAAGALTSLMYVSLKYELNGTAPFIIILILIAIALLYRLWIIANKPDLERM